ncbi:6-phosphogluconolactonase [Aestuariimicrobium sp. Y1814]|uniref:6-phosphogluconolactonase n=1 Tax=Aestuariimicrobium sp. Y1814 TaxID=3418742 RepID=UPI003DA77DB7
MSTRTQVPRVLRYSSSDELADAVASLLLTRLVELQAKGEVHVCLTGGRIANRMYESLASLAEGSELDPSKLHLWWGDERFVPLTDPDRNASQSFGILARTISLRPGQTHAMPATDGRADSDEAAFSYARELGDTVFDVCLLGMGEDGHVASLFPNHPSFTQPTSAMVIGVSDSPKPPSERVSLTIPAINRSRAVWVLVSGEAKAEAVQRTIGGDPSLPATAVQGREETFFFLDQAAASLLPRYNCQL